MTGWRMRAFGILAVIGLLVGGPAAFGQCENVKLFAADGDVRDSFGSATAAAPDFVVVTAPLDDDRGEQAGAAYVFERAQDGAWREAAKLLAEDGVDRDQLGRAALASGNLAFVSSAAQGFAGAVYVFEHREDRWPQVAKLEPRGATLGADFGWSLAVEGDILVVGARSDNQPEDNSGSAFIFERDEQGRWLQTAMLTAADPGDGDSFGVAAAIDGETILIGAWGDDEAGSNAGAAYIFEPDKNGAWQQTAKLMVQGGEPTHDFGAAVAIDGDRVLIGAPFEDNQRGKRTGAAYIFERVSPGGAWARRARLLGGAVADSKAGGSVALRGDIAIVGALSHDERGGSSGAAFFFKRGPDGKWRQRSKLIPAENTSPHGFGHSLSLGDDFVLISATRAPGRVEDTGAAYVYTLSGCGPGDANCDGSIDLTDVGPFITALLDPAAYQQQYPNCRLDTADLNSDGSVDLSDVEPFIACLLSGECD